MNRSILALGFCMLLLHGAAQQKRARELGVRIGVMSPGSLNAITDVAGIKVGHTTLIRGDSVRTGVTAILPHDGNIFQHKVPAAIFVGNGFGKLAGTTQVMELGNLESPVILTNTLAVSTAMSAPVGYVIQLFRPMVKRLCSLIKATCTGYLLPAESHSAYHARGPRFYAGMEP
jgi:D-aminopeptidase